jgi:hypothetical protein
MGSLKMGDGLDVIDHESTAGQGDGKRFGDGVVGHIDIIPRLSSRSTQALSVRLYDARNTWYVVVGMGSQRAWHWYLSMALTGIGTSNRIVIGRKSGAYLWK